MEKLLTYPGKTENGVHTFLINQEQNHLIKTAAEYHPTIASYINASKPIPGVTQVLLTAMGAGEYWGANVNGDWFGEDQLAHEGEDYGFKTFEMYAKLYKHHVNKDPSASYGDVLLAVYNPIYHRVELVVGIRHDRAYDIVERIENGDYPVWSMGCLSKNSKLLMVDGSEKKVSEVVSGDKIIDGTGQAGTVSYPHSHKHSGTWYAIKTLGLLRDPEKTTEEHPWLVIPKEQTTCSGNPNNKSRKIGRCFPNREHKKCCVLCPNAQEYKKEWRRADELTVGDYIATPIPQGETSGVDHGFAFLAGHYLANGYGAKERYLILTVHNDKLWIMDELKRFYPEAKIYSRPRSNSDLASDIIVADKDLYRSIVGTFGRTLNDKTVFPAMFWEKSAQKALLGAIIDGDGGCYKNALYISTSKDSLAYHLQLMLARVGCVSSVNTIHHSPSSLVQKETTEYQVWIGADSAQNLKDYCNCGENIQQPAVTKNLRFIYDGYLWSPILDIECEDCEEVVYNVAIESGDYDRDSYVVNGVALHNCKIPFDICNICGNRAPNRKHYCEHLRYMLNQIDPVTGKQVYAINIRPKFFDISYVLVQADKTAMTLKKVASVVVPQNYPGSAEIAEKVSQATKRSEIDKRIPADGPPSSQDLLTSEQARQAARTILEVRRRERPIPHETIDRLCGMGPMEEVLSTMQSALMVPTPQEFQRIFLIYNNRRADADKLDRINAVFDPTTLPEQMPAHRPLGISPSRVRGDMLQVLQPHMEDRSYSAPLIVKRMHRMVKEANHYYQEPPRYIDTRKGGNDSSILPLLGVGSALYAALMVENKTKMFSSFAKLVSQHPTISLGLGVGAIMGARKVRDVANRNVTRGSFTQDTSLYPDTFDLYDRIERTGAKPYMKLSQETGGASMERLLVGMPQTFMVSCASQRHGSLSPSDSEMAIYKVAQDLSDLLSGPPQVDAALVGRGNGPWLTQPQLLKAAGVLEESTPCSSKSASISEYIGESLFDGERLGVGPWDAEILDLGAKLEKLRR